MRSGIRAKLVGAVGLAVLLAAAAPYAAPDVANAAMRGDREAVRALLQQGADVNMAQGDGMTALHWAAERGDAEMSSMLLFAGAGVKAVTRIGDYTPLHLAGKGGNSQVIDLLLKGGADPNAVTSNSGATPLHLAAASGDVRSVELLLDRGAAVDARESLWQQTPLVFAASLNRADVIRVLISRGADPNLHTGVVSDEVRAADEAATTRQREVLDAIRGSGKEPTPAQIQAAIEAGRQARSGSTDAEVPAATEQPVNRDPDEVNFGQATLPGGLTALLHAARQGHVEAVRALLDGGADINQATLIDNTTPLLIAVINSQWDAALLLVERGADPNVASTVSGTAAVWSTVNAQHQPRTRFPQPQESWYQQASYIDVLEALLVAGGDPDAITPRQPFYLNFSGCGNGNCGLTALGGTTAFWRAANSADVAALRLLVKYGADPKIARTPAPAGGGRGGGGGGAGAAAQFARGGGPPAAAGAPDPAAARGAGAGGAPGAAGGRAGGGGGGGGGGGAPAGPQVPALPATAIHAAAGIGFGQGVGAGNANRFTPEGWMPSMRYIVEELGFDVNARDDQGFTPLHFAAARGDREMILYLVEKGADPKAVSRTGYTTADMANGPQARITPMPAIVELMVSLGSANSNNCRSCE